MAIPGRVWRKVASEVSLTVVSWRTSSSSAGKSRTSSSTASSHQGPARPSRRIALARRAAALKIESSNAHVDHHRLNRAFGAHEGGSHGPRTWNGESSSSAKSGVVEYLGAVSTTTIVVVWSWASTLTLTQVRMASLRHKIRDTCRAVMRQARSDLGHPP